MSRGRGVLVLDNISSYSLAEDNGAGHPFNNSWHHTELESGPIWVTASALERRAVHIDGDNAAIVSECIHHNTILIRRALLFGPRVGLNVIHHHTLKNRIFRLDQI